MTDDTAEGTDATTPTALDRARDEFREALLKSGLLVDAGEPGLYGRSGAFDALLNGLDLAITERMSFLDARVLRFPPVFPRAEFERTDYIASFPNLTASVSSFTGGDREHAALLAARARGEDWNSWLEPVETMLVPAVCHPLYERMSGERMPEGGRYFDLAGYSFRHEPSPDPMRLQAFRIHEWVYIGEPATARQRRDEWADIQNALLIELGLDARMVAANDPFFGRAGRILIRNQLNDNLKIEQVVPIYPGLDDGTAVGSANIHGEHFGAAFGILTSDGAVANTACIGYGMERITLALLRTHGLDLSAWPAAVATRLGIQ